MKLSEIAYQPGYSSSTIQIYRNDLNMLSTYRIQANYSNKRLKKHTFTNFDETPHSRQDLKRPQMTSNDLKRPQSIAESSPEVKPGKSENRVKSGAKIETHDDYLDENLHYKDS